MGSPTLFNSPFPLASPSNPFVASAPSAASSDGLLRARPIHPARAAASSPLRTLSSSASAPASALPPLPPPLPPPLLLRRAIEDGPVAFLKPVESLAQVVLVLLIRTAERREERHRGRLGNVPSPLRSLLVGLLVGLRPSLKVHCESVPKALTEEIVCGLCSSTSYQTPINDAI